MSSQIIDIHPHIVSNDSQKYPVAPILGRRSDWSAQRPKTFEDLCLGLAQAGIRKACIVHSSTTYGFDNRYLADSIEGQLSRFAGVCSIDLIAPDAVETLRYWISRGLSGLRIYTGGSTFDGQSTLLADPRTFPVWEEAIALGITITVQLRPEGLPQLIEMIERFPRARLLIDNLLRPNYAEGPPYAGSDHVFCLTKYPNVHMKIITNSIRGSYEGKSSPHSFFPRLVDAFGAQRLAWGSNYPASEGSLPELLEEAQIALACLSGADREWIFARTAQELFPSLRD